MSDLVEKLTSNKLGTSGLIFGIGFGGFLISMVMIFGFGGLGIALGIPIGIVSLIATVIGGIALGCIFGEWMDN